MPFCSAAQLFHEVKVVEHLLVALLRAAVLVLKDLRCRPCIARVKQHEVVFEVRQRFRTHRERTNVDLPFQVDIETGNSTECSYVLILLSYWLA